MKQKLLIPILLAVLCAAVGIYFFINVDMTGAPYSEIEAYMAEHPNKHITYNVTIESDAPPMTITSKQTEAFCILSQIDSLVEQAEYLHHLTKIDFSTDIMDIDSYQQLRSAFPNAELSFNYITLLDEIYPTNAQHLTFSSLTDEQFLQLADAAEMFSNLTQVTIQSPEDSIYTTENAVALAAAMPDVTIDMTFDLFGQPVSTDMERIEYFQADIGGDAGLDVIRSIMPIMDKLTYLKLDWCGTTDEATAALRDELANRCKVVWRVFLTDEYNALTDTYKIWAQFQLWGEDVECLKYCTEVRYIDLGHSYVDNCEFVKYMPYLNTLILSDSRLESLEPLRTCENLTYLEIFTTKVADISPLTDLPQLEYLNISNCKITDISPLYDLENLVIVNCTMANIPDDQIKYFKETHPDTKCTFNWYQSPTEYCWRHGPTPEGYRRTPRYALLREQIGYDTKDYSRYPTGYVTEEITYESTGIIPHTELDYEVYPK